MATIASQIPCLTIVYSIIYSDADQRKHQSSASLAFVRGIHRFRNLTRIFFPFDDVIMTYVFLRGTRTSSKNTSKSMPNVVVNNKPVGGISARTSYGRDVVLWAKFNTSRPWQKRPKFGLILQRGTRPISCHALKNWTELGMHLYEWISNVVSNCSVPHLLADRRPPMNNVDVNIRNL